MTTVNEMPPEGTHSEDGVAVVGKEGHLFLKEGNNNLLRQYAMPGDKVGLYAGPWHEIITTRYRAVSALGIDFMQVLIPEKSTALRHLLPFSIPQAPTPVYQQLVRDLSSAHYFFDTLPLFLGHDQPTTLFGKVDTHTTVEGAQMLAAAVADRIDPAVSAAIRDVELPHLNDEIGRSGDLGTKFDPQITAETQRDVFDSSLPGMTESVKLVELHKPDTGLTGTVMGWKSDSATSPLKVMVFGNSFFERGGQSGRLSWWFKHFFSEFIFCWNPALDLELVEKHQPDLVICQTVERFLTQIPKG